MLFNVDRSVREGPTYSLCTYIKFYDCPLCELTIAAVHHPGDLVL